MKTLNRFIKGYGRGAVIVFCWIFVFQTSLYALPQGGAIENGNVTFESPDPSTLTVNASDKAIINWQSFNIAQGETVNFVQPSAMAAALNRVVGGGGASMINGALNANGTIILVNPGGIMIGQTANINVGSLQSGLTAAQASSFIASSLNISSNDFKAGNYIFSKEGMLSAAVVNRGLITVKGGGLVALFGGSVENSGTINAKLGKVVLASGDKITVNFTQSGLIAVAVDEKIVGGVVSVNGEAVKDAIKNLGTIAADGGQVILTADAVSGIFDKAVNNEGIVRANSVIEHDGIIELVSKTGTTENKGIIQAKGTEENADGGKISFLGYKAVNSGVIDVGADNGGTAGYVSVLSDMGGTVLADGSAIYADGKDFMSNAGDVRINSLGDTYFAPGAVIDISGGSVSGDGGFADVSAHGGLGFYGQVNGLTQAGYKESTLLLDPLFINVVQGFFFGGGGQDDSEISGDGIVLSGEWPGQTLSISNIAIQNFWGNVSLAATAGITVGATITKNNGGLALATDAGDISLSYASITATNITFNAGNNISLNSNSSLTGGNIALTAVNGNITWETGTINATGAVTLSAPNGAMGTAANPVIIGASSTPSSLSVRGMNDIFVTHNSVPLNLTSGLLAIGDSMNVGNISVTHDGPAALTIMGPINVGANSLYLKSNNSAITDMGGTVTSGALTLEGAGAVSVLSSKTASGDVNLTVNGAGGGITVTSPITSTGTITMTSDMIAINTPLSTSMVLQPSSDTTSIGIGDSTGKTLELNTTTISNLSGMGGGTVTIGRSTGQHEIKINAVTFSLPTTVRTPSGGSISVDGQINVGSGLTLDGPGATTTLNANIISNGWPISIDDSVVLGDGLSITLDSTNGGLFSGGSISIAGTVNGTAGGGSETLDIRGGTGAITLGGAVGGSTPLSALTIVSGPTSVNGGSVTTSGAQTYNEAVTLGADAAFTGSLLTFNSTLNGSGRSITLTEDTLSLGNTITSAGGNLTLQPLTASSSIGIGDEALAPGAFHVSSTELSYLTDGFSSITIGRSNGTGVVNISAVTFNDPVTIRTPASGGSISTLGQITGAGNASITLDGSGATTTLQANIVTSGGAITISDSVILGVSPLTLDSTNGGASSGANIAITGAVDGNTPWTNSLSLRAGSGDITLGGNVGGTSALSGFTITSADDVTAGAVTASTITQSAGTGTTTFGGALTAAAAGGISLTGNNFTLNGAVITGSGGPMTIANTGTLTIGSAGDMSLDGAFNQSGSGPVSTAGDITTTNDALAFTGPVTLTGPVSLSTGTGAGNISFASTINGTTAGADNLSLLAGTGSITFSGAMGETTRLGTVTITSATGVTANAGANLVAAGLTESANTGTNTWRNINTTGNILLRPSGAINILYGTITTTGGGTFTATHSNILQFRDQLNLDGAFNQSAAQNVYLYSNIYTTGDTISFAGPISLYGNDILDTTNSGGSPSGANITFTNNINTGSGQTAKDLTLNAGSAGNISFGALSAFGTVAVGGRLNSFTIQNAADVSFNRNVTHRTKNFTQSAGTGTFTFVGTLDTTGDIAVATSGAGGISFSNAITDITSTGSSITLSGEEINISGAVTCPNGTVVLQPYNAATSIGIAGGAGTLELTATELGRLTDGLGGITIGRSDGQHAIAVSAVTFNDPVTIRTPSGGSIAVNGQITGSGNATVTLTGSGATTTLNSDIVTAGNAITINDSVVIGDGLGINLNTTDGGAAGANISVTGTINGTAGGVGEGIVVRGGTGTNTFGGAIGTGSPLDTFVIISGDAAINGGAVTTSGAQTYSTPVTVGANATFTGGSLTFNNTLSGGARDIILSSDTIDFSAAVSGTAALTLMPFNPTTSIGIAGGVGTLQLTLAELGLITDGFGSITIGRSNGQHAIDIGAVTFNDPVTIRTPSGGSITVSGQITGSGNGSVAFTGSGSTTTLNADIITAGTAININDSVVIGDGNSVRLDSTNWGAVPAGANITVTGTINGTAGGGNETLTLLSGTAAGPPAGDIDLQGIIGGTAPLYGFNVNNSDVVTLREMHLGTNGGTPNLIKGTTINLNGPVSSDGWIDLKSGGTINIAAAADITSAGSVGVYDGPTMNTAGDITSTGGGTITLMNTVLTGPVVINAQTGRINLTGTVTGGSALTLTADEIDIGAGITLGGADVILQPYTPTTSIGIAGGAGSLQLTSAEVGFLTDGLNSITIGRSNGQHDINVSAVTFNDPVTIRTPSGGSIAVNGQITGGGNASVTLTGATNLNNSIIATGNPITFNSAVTLGASPTLGGAGITFNSTLNGGQALIINDSGATAFGGVVGGVTPLTSITTNAGGTTAINTTGVTTTGAQTYNDAVTLGANAALAGSGVTFSSTLNSSGAARQLTVNTSGSGITRFDGNVGGVLALDRLTTNADGTTEIRCANISVSGSTIIFNDPVKIFQNTAITDTGTTGITFNNRVDGNIADLELTLTAAAGNVTFGTVAGGAFQLKKVTMTSGGLGVNTANYTTAATTRLTATEAGIVNGAEAWWNSGAGSVRIWPWTAAAVTYVGALQSAGAATVNSSAMDKEIKPSGQTGRVATIEKKVEASFGEFNAEYIEQYNYDVSAPKGAVTMSPQLLSAIIMDTTNSRIPNVNNKPCTLNEHNGITACSLQPKSWMDRIAENIAAYEKIMYLFGIESLPQRQGKPAQLPPYTPPDPDQVAKAALQNAAQVAADLLTTEAMVSEINDKESKAGKNAEEDKKD